MQRKTLVSLFSIALLAATVMSPLVEAQDDNNQDGNRQGRREGGRRGRFGGGGPRGFGGPGGFGRGGFGGVAALNVLRMDEVREEVKVTEDQQELIDILRDELNEGRPESSGNFFEMTEEEREAYREKMSAWNDEQTAQANETLKTILEEPQFKRLQEIVIQTQGVRALFEKDVSTKLGLSEEQLTTLRETEEQSRQDMFARMREGGGFGRGDGDFDPDSFRERMETARKEQEEKMFAVLTPEQRTAFEAMKGEKFDMPERGFGFGGRGGRGLGGQRDSDRPQRPE